MLEASNEALSKLILDNQKQLDINNSTLNELMEIQKHEKYLQENSKDLAIKNFTSNEIDKIKQKINKLKLNEKDNEVKLFKISLDNENKLKS